MEGLKLAGLEAPEVNQFELHVFNQQKETVEYCQANGKQIVGYYQANELCDDLDLGPFGKKIVEKIRSQCASACCLMLDGAKMRPSPDDLKLLCLAADGKRYGVTPTLAPNAEAAIAAVESAIGKGQQHEIVDFDAVSLALRTQPCATHSPRASACSTHTACLSRVPFLASCLPLFLTRASAHDLSPYAASRRREQGLASERDAARLSERAFVRRPMCILTSSFQSLRVLGCPVGRRPSFAPGLSTASSHPHPVPI